MISPQNLWNLQTGRCRHLSCNSESKGTCSLHMSERGAGMKVFLFIKMFLFYVCRCFVPLYICVSCALARRRRMLDPLKLWSRRLCVHCRTEGQDTVVRAIAIYMEMTQRKIFHLTRAQALCQALRWRNQFSLCGVYYESHRWPRRGRGPIMIL